MVVNSRDTAEDTELKMLSRDVQIKILERYIKQYKLRNIFKHRILSEYKDGNLKTHKRIYMVRQYHFDESYSISKNNPVPKYARTRHVTIQFTEWKGDACLITTCDCGYIYRERHLCRHVQHILNEKPCLDHFHPKCYKSYFNFMFRNDEYTNMIDQYDALFRLRKGLIFCINKYNGCVKDVYCDKVHLISNLFAMSQRFLPSPPASTEHDNESWFLNPLSAPLDLNPYFHKDKSIDEMLPLSGEDLPSINDCAKKTSKTKSNYELFYREFIDVMEKSEENNPNVREIIKNKFSKMKIMVLQESSRKYPSATTNSIALFLPIEKNGNRKRLAPPSSPKSNKK